MAKIKSQYSCTECGAVSPKWQGQCPGCNAWNTLVETVAETAPASNSRFAALGGTAKLQTLSEIEAREEDRLPTGIGEFDPAADAVEQLDTVMLFEILDRRADR